MVAVLAEDASWCQQHVWVANQAIALTLHTVISRLVGGCHGQPQSWTKGFVQLFAVLKQRFGLTGTISSTGPLLVYAHAVPLGAAGLPRYNRRD